MTVIHELCAYDRTTEMIAMEVRIPPALLPVVRTLIEPEPDENGFALAKKIAAEIDRKLGIRVAVETVPSGKLPRFEMKARRFVTT